MADINTITDEDIMQFEGELQYLGTTHDAGNTFDLYQQIATKTARYPGVRSPLGLMYVNAKLNGEAGEFSEHLGKAFRDDGFANGLYYDGGAVQQNGTPLTSERLESLLKELGDVIRYISAACNELGVPMSKVALMNLHKLNGRAKRGTLSGSGDNR